MVELEGTKVWPLSRVKKSMNVWRTFFAGQSPNCDVVAKREEEEGVEAAIVLRLFVVSGDAMKAVPWVVVVVVGACLGRVRLRGVSTVAALAVNERSWKSEVEAVPLTSMHLWL